MQIAKKGRFVALPRTSTAEKITASLKGLRDHLQPGEQPLFTIPGIWDGGQGRHSTACDIVLTNQRLFGYYFVRFPRERLFLDALPAAGITNVSLRQKSFEPLFRELLVSDGTRKVYIRAPRQKIEALYAALRQTSESHGIADETTTATVADASAPRPFPVYGRQEIRKPFENSPLALTLLFAGGVILEIIGVVLWSITQSANAGLPLCVAGFIAVLMAIVVKRQRR